MSRDRNDDQRDEAPSAAGAASPPAKGLDDVEATRQARRRLLKMAVYSAPIVIGTFFSQDAEAASCQPRECNPVPCDPRGCLPMQ